MSDIKYKIMRDDSLNINHDKPRTSFAFDMLYGMRVQSNEDFAITMIKAMAQADSIKNIEAIKIKMKVLYNHSQRPNDYRQRVQYRWNVRRAENERKALDEATKNIQYKEPVKSLRRL